MWWPSQTKDMQQNSFCVGMVTDTEHTTSCSNEEETASIPYVMINTFIIADKDKLCFIT